MSESILGAFQVNSNEPMFHLIGKYDNQTSGANIPKADIASCWILCPLLRFNTTFHDSSETELKIQILAKYHLIFSSNTINAGTEFLLPILMRNATRNDIYYESYTPHFSIFNDSTYSPSIYGFIGDTSPVQTYNFTPPAGTFSIYLYGF